MENRNVHGATMNQTDCALLLIDVINDLEFPEADPLLLMALPMARRLLVLKARAQAAGVPVVYVNDNFGRWRSDFEAQVNHCLHDGVRGQPIAEILRPTETDYFVLKPMHSGFYCTPLDLLLRHLHVKTVVLTGIAANICVLFTASDAYSRHYRLCVPADCVAANSEAERDQALDLMQRTLKADISVSSTINFSGRA